MKLRYSSQVSVGLKSDGYRDHKKIEELQRNVAEAQQAGDDGMVARAQRSLNAALAQNTLPSKVFARTCEDLDGLYNCASTPVDSTFPQLPSSGTKEDYLKYLALLLPAGLWSKVPPNNPVHTLSINIVQGILHSDKAFSRHNHLDSWINTEKKLEASQNFNAAVDAAKLWWRNVDEMKRANLTCNGLRRGCVGNIIVHG